MKTNLLTLTDSYKFSHWKQYPKGTETVVSYFESRVGAKFKTTVFFGLQAFIKEYLEGVVVTRAKINQAKDLVDAHVGPGTFNEEGWNYILNTHGGYLPVKIKAVPEGTVVGVSNVLMTIENTDPKCFWLTNYLETLLVQVWYASTVATQSREMKKIIDRYLRDTTDLEEDALQGVLNFRLHDFGFRGVSSVESAGMGGMAHLVNFMGTDTVRGIEYAMEYYGAGVCAYSIPASEHSTMTSWGREGEAAAMLNMLTQYPTGLVACVSDSWDIYNACRNIWGEELKDAVLAREGCLVVRPDSGDAIKLIPDLMRTLGEKLGQTRNKKGFFVLNPKVRMIQGDGITFESLEGLLKAVKDSGYSTENIAFGSGGGLLQMLNRDTQRFAFKCSAIKVNGEWRDVFKQPITDGSKSSKKGRLKLIKATELNPSLKINDGEVNSLLTVNIEDPGVDILQTVFENGHYTVDQTFDEVRQRAALPTPVAV